MISTDKFSPAASPQSQSAAATQLQIQPLPGGVRNVVTDLISSNLGSRIIPKIGSIVKRFSLNYSGEGLVTDPQRVRTVRVGIKFQVQVDSFLNNREQLQQGNRPRAILRANSAPSESIEFHNSNSTHSSTNNIETCNQLPQRGANRALTYGSHSPSISSSNINIIQQQKSSSCEVSPRSSSPPLDRGYCSLGSLPTTSSDDSSSPNCEITELDSSSGVSSLAGSASHSPVVSRKQSSSQLAFHNRINQALTVYRSQSAAAVTRRNGGGTAARRASVQVLRRGSITPERRSIDHSPTQSASPSQRSSIMEDASSYQVLRYFPGSNVDNVRDFNWETAAFEKDVQDRVKWLGSKFSHIKVPPFVTRAMGQAKTYAAENPISALLILAISIACSLPISIFLGFAVATILFSFIGFLLVEGTLLTVATVSLGGVVLVVGLITLGVLLVGFMGYSVTSKIYNFVTGGNHDDDDDDDE